MMKKKINQNLINLVEYYKLMNFNIFFSQKPIQRTIKDNSFNAQNKSKSLLILRKKIENIKGCNLKKSAKQIVFADGNENAKLMIVGEGPGAQEDAQGIPFVGRAGQLLDKMLAAINLDRKKVYISNVVNYRPPENRKPSEKEIERYLPFLKEHIELIKPKILLLMGSTALNAIVGKANVISKARGKWLKMSINSVSLDVIASFHPAFLMRQPDQKKFAWEDLKKIRKRLLEI